MSTVKSKHEAEEGSLYMKYFHQHAQEKMSIGFELNEFAYGPVRTWV